MNNTEKVEFLIQNLNITEQEALAKLEENNGDVFSILKNNFKIESTEKRANTNNQEHFRIIRNKLNLQK
tara:strand:- start:254 stop:460 length:207 start_codon:yes stop_codon:yes gene_type:complete